MRKKNRVFVSIAILILIVSFVRFPSNADEAQGGVKKFGPLTLGAMLPAGSSGDFTFAPINSIPLSRFYVAVVESDRWCSNENCSLNGALIRTMGGWIEVASTKQAGFADEDYGLDVKENKSVKSLVLIGDHNGKMVGIYPNKNIGDIITILKRHPDLANFNLLKGVKEFGLLKVGTLSPIKPGDLTGYTPDKPAAFPVARIPKDKKFYLFALQKSILAKGFYCAFLSCLEPEQFDYIENLGGWFSSDGKPETVRLFGLDPKEVLSGRSSLVVVTDPRGIIAAIHPNKTISDALSILSQHSDLADVEALYRR